MPYISLVLVAPCLQILNTKYLVKHKSTQLAEDFSGKLANLSTAIYANITMLEEYIFAQVYAMCENEIKGNFYQPSLGGIWIHNYAHHCMWDVTTQPCSNCNGGSTAALG